MDIVEARGVGAVDGTVLTNAVPLIDEDGIVVIPNGMTEVSERTLDHWEIKNDFPTKNCEALLGQFVNFQFTPT